MKGTEQVLVLGETPNDKKADILDDIKLSRAIVELLTSKQTKNPQDFAESVGIVRAEIRQSVAQLVTLERWRIKNKDGKDQWYVPANFKLRESNEQE